MNSEQLKQKTRKNKVAFYLAVGIGLLFIAMGFLSWNNAVKETAQHRTLEEQIIEEEEWRSEYIEKIESYIKVEAEYEALAAEKQYVPGRIPEGQALTEYKEFVSQLIVMEKEKWVYLRQSKAPVYFSVPQAKNLTATASLTDNLELLLESIDKRDAEGIKKAEAGVAQAREDLDTARLSFESAKKTSLARLEKKREELEE